jgi:hypothetical protein
MKKILVVQKLDPMRGDREIRRVHGKVQSDVESMMLS